MEITSIVNEKKNGNSLEIINNSKSSNIKFEKKITYNTYQFNYTSISGLFEY